jgi:hypothetical protein
MLYLFDCRNRHFWFSASEEPERCETCGELCKDPAILEAEGIAEYLNSNTRSAKNKAPRRVL